MKTNEKTTTKGKKVWSIISNVLFWIFLAIFAVYFVFRIDGYAERGKHFGYSDIYFGTSFPLVLTDSMDPAYPVNTLLYERIEDADTIYKQYLENEEANKPLKEEYDKKIEEAKNAEEKTSLKLEYESKCRHIDISFFDGYTTNAKPTDTTNYFDNTSNTNTRMTHRLREIQLNENVEKGKGRYLFFVSGINYSKYGSLTGQYQVFTEEYILGVVKGTLKGAGKVVSVLMTPWGYLILLLLPALYLIFVSIRDILRIVNEKEEKEEEPKEEVKGEDALSALSEEDKERLKSEMLEELLHKKDDK